MRGGIALLFIMFVIVTFVNAAPLNKGKKQIEISIGDIITFNGKKWQVEDKQNSRLYVCPYHGDESFYKGSDWGWFYGENCRWIEGKILTSKRQIQKKEKKHQKESIPWDRLTDDKYLSTLTANQFKQLYEKVRQIAVMDPAKEHIHAYVHMTDFMRRKALIFAHAVSDFILENPVYDMQKETGTTSWAYRFSFKVRQRERDAFLKNLKDRAGLYFFVSANCPYCKEQSKIINWFIADYEWNVISVASDFCAQEYPDCMVAPELFEVFNVQYTPSIYLIYRQKDKPLIFPVANGLTDYGTLKARIYYYLKKIKEKENNKIISPGSYYISERKIKRKITGEQ